MIGYKEIFPGITALKAPPPPCPPPPRRREGGGLVFGGFLATRGTASPKNRKGGDFRRKVAQLDRDIITQLILKVHTPAC